MALNEKRELRERNSLQLHITILVEFVKNYFDRGIVAEIGKAEKKEKLKKNALC